MLERHRTFDSDGYVQRAACLCFRDDSYHEVLLVSSRKFTSWIVPGGGIEPEEEPSLAAQRECQEEAGVLGLLGKYLGIFEDSRRNTRTHVYTIVAQTILEIYDDTQIGRQRKWFPIEDAMLELNKLNPIQSLYIRSWLQNQQPGSPPPQSVVQSESQACVL